jgi:exonuclease III
VCGAGDVTTSSAAPGLRIITWNVARRTTRLADQAAALASRRPDIVTLQEITRRTDPLWRRAFELLGLGHVRSAGDAPGVAERRTPMWVMLASRAPLAPAQHALNVPRLESAVSAVAETELGPVEVHGVHVPNAANGWVKVRTLEAIRHGLAAAGPGARVLCGDLNTPRRELPSGETISFARDTHGRLRPERGEEWDSAELGVVPGLRELGYRDAFRSLHGYGSREPSWTWKRIAGHRGGWRLDHLFASTELTPVACRYLHEWRDEDLSDHSALEADFVSPSR